MYHPRVSSSSSMCMRVEELTLQFFPTALILQLLSYRISHISIYVFVHQLSNFFFKKFHFSMCCDMNECGYRGLLDSSRPVL